MPAPVRPIIFVDNDEEDLYLVRSALFELGIQSPFRHFNTGAEVLEYLNKTMEQPFLILCDISLPKRDGLELRDYIMNDEKLRKKAIPFIFFTDYATQENVNDAYRLMVQGFFAKPADFEMLKDMLQSIVSYWDSCLHPNRLLAH
jgi:CheY-like chemotaxis protein